MDTSVAIYLATEHSLTGPYLSLIEGRAQALSFASAAELIYTSRRSRNPRRDAATAIQHALPLVTHNVRDFADIPGLTVLSVTPSGH
jgi:predicted nucleic acid-binding protein